MYSWTHCAKSVCNFMVKYFNQYCIYTITSSYESIVGIQPAKKERRKGKKALEGPEPRVFLSRLYFNNRFITITHLFLYDYLELKIR